MASFEKEEINGVFKVHFKDHNGDKKYITKSGYRTKTEAKKQLLKLKVS